MMNRFFASKEPIVSIIISTYKRPKYLKEALESAIKQSFTNFEIIVSDDGSPESPQDIIDAFSDSRIRFIRNEQNVGITLNLAGAFEAARGKYVACLNDDDLWNEDFLTTLVPILESNSELIVAFSDHYIVDEKSRIDYQATKENTSRWKRDQIQEGIHQPFYAIAMVDEAVHVANAAVIRKDWIDWDAFRKAGVAGMGRHWDLYLRYLVCRDGHGAYYTPKRLTRYRVHSQGVTSLTGRKSLEAKILSAQSWLIIYEQCINDPALHQLHPFFCRKLAFAYATLGIGLLRIQEYQKARSNLLAALRQDWRNVRALAALLLSYAPYSLASRI